MWFSQVGHRQYSGFTQSWKSIGLYRKNAIAIESEANDSFGGNVYYGTMQITLPIPEFSVTNVIFIVTYYTLPRIESSPSFWMTRSQRSRRRDKGLWTKFGHGKLAKNIVTEIENILKKSETRVCSNKKGNWCESQTSRT